ncbi:MAG: phospholipid carrier-dependent glycosyltransferase [Lachnospiraceae bacterium]|nr:phospholipid carrier-dependent glycosyltransferase [Lachnospiraceae bacterium]
MIFSLVFWRFAIPSVKEKTITVGNLTVPLFFILALVLRIVLSTKYIGFGTDIACFSGWADRMANYGPAKFYAKDYFSDYPPLYLYVLYVIGLIKKTFQIAPYSQIHVILLKSPAILADLGIGYIIYKVGTKRIGLVHGICLSALYLFQPVVLMNSCLWGQIDSVFTLFLLMTCLFLERQNLLPAMIFFGLGLLLKPQMLIFSPVMIVGAISYFFRGSFSMRMFAKALAYGLLTLILMILVATPFGMENVLSQYLDTVSSYPYASVNAYNFWAGVGMNWHKQDTIFCGMPCSTWGFIAIVLAASFAVILGVKLGNLHGKYFVVAAFLILTVFTFSVRMHERYLFPAMPLLLLGFTGFASRQVYAASAPGPDGSQTGSLYPALRIGYPLVTTLLITLHFGNTGHVLFYYDPSNYDPSNPMIRFVGIGMTVTALFFYFILLRLQSKAELTMTASRTNIRMSKAPLRIHRELTRMTRLDYLLLVFITVLYGAFALHDLGDRVAPETVYEPQRGKTITFDFPEGKKAKSVYYYIAPDHNQSYLFRCMDEKDQVEENALLTMETVFCWKELSLAIPSTSVSITAQYANYHVIELVFKDEDDNVITPVNAADYPELFDEQALFPEKISFRNGTYFDEIYHARTAYEFLQGTRSYENTHPPMGKILISIGISIFGMNAFGWRIIGTLIGIAMLPILYLFAKKLTGDTPAAALTCFIFAFDFMHFAQTRIATIDVYIVFFIICMYYFLYLFLCKDLTAEPLKKLLPPLALCGLSMGLGVASKWTGVYAGIGMGLLFFGHLFYVYRRTRAKVLQAVGNTSDSTANATKGRFSQWLKSEVGKKVIKLCGFCCIFFVAVPIAIYLLSYIPLGMAMAAA